MGIQREVPETVDQLILGPYGQRKDTKRISEKLLAEVALNYLSKLAIDPLSGLGQSILERTTMYLNRGDYPGVAYVQGFLDAILQGERHIPLESFSVPNFWPVLRNEHTPETVGEKGENRAFLAPKLPTNNNYYFHVEVGVSDNVPVTRYTLGHNDRRHIFLTTHPPEAYERVKMQPFVPFAEIASFWVRGEQRILDEGGRRDGLRHIPK